MRWLLAPFLALLWLTGTGAAGWGGEPEIWFNPNSRADWLNLWTDDAPWQNAAKRVRVIGIASWWLNDGTDDQILSIFAFAKRHHMKVEMETSMIAHYTTEACGHIEGYSFPSEIAAQVAVLTRLNLHIDILTMDEPVWWGHYDTEAASCQLSIPDIVDRVVVNYDIILAQNPGIRIVEIEPIPGVTNFPDWRETLSTFRILLFQKTGQQIRDIQLDTAWDNPSWMQPMQDMQSFAHQNNMGLGFYMYGGAYATSDTQWINEAVQHMETAEGALGIIPDQAIFSSWSTHPVSTMPETSPTTMTWLINRYFRERTLIEAQFTGRGVRGKLTTTHGKPIANATINGYVPGVNFTQPLPTTVDQGVVPPQAAYGLIGYRLNVECFCTGMNDVLIGLLQYQETQGGSASYSWSFPFTQQVYNGVIVDAEWVGGIQVSRVIATPTQALAANSAFFPVTPGAQFNFTVPASTIGGEGWYGHAMTLFFDQNMNGLPGAVFVVPDPGKRLMSTATTAADGTFQLPALPRVGPGSAPVTVEFAGDDNHRAVAWSPLR
jgi:hypothetical protein